MSARCKQKNAIPSPVRQHDLFADSTRAPNGLITREPSWLESAVEDDSLTILAQFIAIMLSQLALNFEVHRKAISAAVGELVNHGYLNKRPQVGTRQSEKFDASAMSESMRHGPKRDDGKPIHRHNARPTSVEAGKAAAKAAPPITKRLLDAFSRADLSADESAERIGASILSVRPRISELVRKGRLLDSGLRRSNESGVRAVVWRLRSSEPQ